MERLEYLAYIKLKNPQKSLHVSRFYQPESEFDRVVEYTPPKNEIPKIIIRRQFQPPFSKFPM